jgi:Mg2+-importing ATPase
MDDVDEELLAQPRHWDIQFIRNFMLVLGSVSSIFDFLTFGLLLWVFNASEAAFHTGWFIESLATQVLVIFVIRTRGSPLRSRPSPLLAASSLAVATAGIVLPYTLVGQWFGFVPLPPAFLAALGAMVVCYLVLAEGVKRWFYHRYPPRGVIRSPIVRSHIPLTGS